MQHCIHNHTGRLTLTFPGLALLFMLTMNTMSRADSWEEIPPLPEPAAGFAAGCVNGRILVAGGTNWRDGVKYWLDSAWRYDPATRQWETGPKLPHPIAYAAFASDGKRLYVAGGGDGAHGRKEVYALEENFQLTHLGDLPEAAVFGGGGLVNGKLHVFGGTRNPDDWTQGSNSLYAIDLSKASITALSPLTDFPHAIGIPAVATTHPSGSLFTFTGAWIDSGQQANNLSHAWRYDTSKAAWEAIAPYPESNRGVFAVALDEHRIYLAGGYGTDEEGFVARSYIYDAKSNAYTPSIPLPLAALTTLVKCGEHLYLIGGEDRMKHRTDACYRIRIADLLSGK